MSEILYLILLSILKLTAGKTTYEVNDEISEIHSILVGHVIENTNKPIAFNLKAPVNPFIGRGPELTHLKLSLADQTITVISGVKGIGKTELAYKFATELKHDNESNIIFLDSTSPETLTSDFKDLAHAIGVKLESQSVLSVIKDIFQRVQNRKALFILDNADSDNILVHTLPQYVANSKFINILITSKTKDWYRLYKVIELAPFTLDEANVYVKQNLLSKVQFIITDEHVKNITDVIGFLPLSLKQFIKYIEEDILLHPTKNMEDYLLELQYKGIFEVETQIRKIHEEYIEDFLHEALKNEAKKVGNKVADQAVDTWNKVKDGTKEGYDYVIEYAVKTYQDDLKPIAYSISDTAKDIGHKIKNLF